LPRLAPKPLYLDEEEREQLLQLLNRHSTPQQIAIRANIVWLADAGRNHRQIARDLNVSLNMAKMWRERWLEGKEKGITVAYKRLFGV